MIKPGLSSKLRRKRAGQPGKLGMIRLYGKAWKALVIKCFDRDGWRCVECGRRGSEFNPLDPAHIVARGAGGSDVLSNLRTLCREDHSRSHNAGR